MKSRWRPCLLGAVLAGMGIIAVWTYVNHRQDRQVLTNYLQSLSVSGERLNIRELLPSPPPADLDGTAPYLQAEARIRGQTGLLITNPPLAMRMVAPGRAMVGWQQPEIRDSEATNSWAEVHAELDAIADALSDLHQLIERPFVDQQFNYELGHQLNVGFLAGQTRTGRRLENAALLALHEGKTSEAFQHVRALLALVKSRTEERLYVTQLIRQSSALRAVSVCWELLRSPDISDAQLLTLQAAWESFEFLAPAERALEMERAFLIQTSREAKASSREFKQLAAPWYVPLPTATTNAGWLDGVWDFARSSLTSARNHTRHQAWQVFWADADELKALKGMQVLLESFRQAGRTGAFVPAIQEQERRFADLGLTETDQGGFFGGEDGDAERDTRTLLSRAAALNGLLLEQVLASETCRYLFVTAIALQRHHLRHGRLPNELAGLCPEFLPGIPRDPGDGQTLRYRPNSDGTFLLYSIGADGVDDHGDARSPNPKARSIAIRNGRDWVWPQPATPEEIASFEEARRTQY